VVEYPVAPDWRTPDSPKVNAKVVLSNDLAARVLDLALADRAPLVQRAETGLLTGASAVDMATRAAQVRTVIHRTAASPRIDWAAEQFCLVRFYDRQRPSYDDYVARVVIDARAGRVISVRGGYGEPQGQSPPGVLPPERVEAIARQAAAHQLPGAPIPSPQVDLIADAAYVVRFPIPPRRNQIGADNYATVMIDAKTGKVLQVLEG
jgi:hypothetical protein